jgi:hypothetical protein
MGKDVPRRATASGDDATARVLSKLRAFIGTLEPDERAALAVLFAPGVAAAFQSGTGGTAEPDALGDEPPVAWDPDRLAASLERHLRELPTRPGGD